MEIGSKAPQPATVDLAMIPTVSIICDFREEHWASMDQVADALWSELNQRHVRVRCIRPTMRLSLIGRMANTGFAIQRACNRYIYYPGYLHWTRKQSDLFHVIDHSYAHLVHQLPAERTVVTCHDIDAFRCLAEPKQVRRSWPFRYISLHILEGMQKAAAVVCVSQATRDELLRYGLADAARIHVVHNCIDSAFSQDPDPAADLELERLLGRRDNNVTELLHVGSIAPRKRLDVLVRVMLDLKRLGESVRLIRVGPALPPDLQSLADRLASDGTVITVPFLPRQVLAALYRRAALLLQPSEAEGFGLTVAEAMACGLPVIASDIAVFREIAGIAPLYAPVADVRAWTESVIALLDENRLRPAAFAARRKAGLEQARRFSSRAHAERMLEIYERVTGRVWSDLGYESCNSLAARLQTFRL